MKVIMPGGASLEEVMAEWDKEAEKKNLRNFLNDKFPSGIAGYGALYALTHPWVIVDNWISNVKWAWQRVFRGWDDRAVWGVHTYLSKLIVEVITALKTKKQGIPVAMFDGLPCDENYNYSEEDEKIAKKRWEIVLDDIVDGFKVYLSDEGCGYFETGSEEEQKFKKAFYLLEKYFGNLWD